MGSPPSCHWWEWWCWYTLGCSSSISCLLLSEVDACEVLVNSLWNRWNKGASILKHIRSHSILLFMWELYLAPHVIVSELLWCDAHHADDSSLTHRTLPYFACKCVVCVCIYASDTIRMLTMVLRLAKMRFSSGCYVGTCMFLGIGGTVELPEVLIGVVGTWFWFSHHWEVAVLLRNNSQYVTGVWWRAGTVQWRVRESSSLGHEWGITEELWSSEDESRIMCHDFEKKLPFHHGAFVIFRLLSYCC